MQVRPALHADLPGILEIYNEAVLNTTATYEYEPKTLEHRLAWFEDQRRVEADPASLGDVVIARKEIPTSYHLAVTVDDALQGITLVTRGADLFAATHSHCLLQAVLGLPVPAYRHHPLLTDAEGKRLAKRDGAPTIRAMREAGMTAGEILAMASQG
jgi:glutamyl-Q tRNA(Asp) synthetase